MGNITGTNLTTTPGQGGDFYLESYYCDAGSPGASCRLGVEFLPRTTGNPTGSLSVPITYADGSKATLTASLTGIGVAPAPALQLSATQLNFYPQVAGSGGMAQALTLINTGNISATIKSVTASANFAVTQNGCTYPATTCPITVAFTPAATAAAGTATGTLTIVDNTPASPHTVKLVGQILSSTQALALSQTALNLGSQTAGTAGQPQAVYLTNRGETAVVVDKLVLTGANATDFTMTQDCGGTLGFNVPPKNSCTIWAAFTPASTSSGTRTAVITITPAAGPVLQIQLTGNATAAAAAIERQVRLPD